MLIDGLSIGKSTIDTLKNSKYVMPNQNVDCVLTESQGLGYHPWLQSGPSRSNRGYHWDKFDQHSEMYRVIPGICVTFCDPDGWDGWHRVINVHVSIQFFFFFFGTEVHYIRIFYFVSHIHVHALIIFKLKNKLDTIVYLGIYILTLLY